jgi:hypothetical protein
VARHGNDAVNTGSPPGVTPAPAAGSGAGHLPTACVVGQDPSPAGQRPADPPRNGEGNRLQGRWAEVDAKAGARRKLPLPTRSDFYPYLGGDWKSPSAGPSAGRRPAPAGKRQHLPSAGQRGSMVVTVVQDVNNQVTVGAGVALSGRRPAGGMVRCRGPGRPAHRRDAEGSAGADAPQHGAALVRPWHGALPAEPRTAADLLPRRAARTADESGTYRP